MSLTLWPRIKMNQLNEFEMLARDIEICLREREWLPWYEVYGPSFLDHMHRYPLERRSPPVSDRPNPATPAR
jgi:hypothetical protein